MVAVGHHHFAVVVFFAAGNLAKERYVGDGDDVIVVLHLGVEQATEEEDSYGDGQTDEETHEGGACLVGRHGGAVDARRVEHFAVGFDGGAADHQFLAAAEEVEVEFLLDFLQALQVFEVELLLGHLAHLAGGVGGLDLGFGDALLQQAYVAVEEAVHVGTQGVDFLHLGFHHGAVGALVFFEFEHQVVVLGDEGHDVGVVEADGGRDDVDGLVGLVELRQVAGLRELFLEAFDFFGRLDARLEVALAVGRDVEQLVFAFEVGQGVLLGAEVGVEHGEALVDVVVGFGDDAFFLLDGVIVVDLDDLVDDLLGADGGGVAEADVDDGVEVVVARNGEGGAVVLGDGGDAGVCHRDGHSVVVGREEPCLVGHDATEGGGHGVLVGGSDGFVVGQGEFELLVVLDGGGEGHVVFLAVVDKVDGDGRLAVEVLGTFDEAGFGGVDDVELQVAGDFGQGGLRGEDHHLVVDGAVVERPGGEHVLDGGLADAAFAVGGGAFDEQACAAGVDTVLVAHIVAGDDGTDGAAEDEPVGVPQQGEENVFDMDLLRFLLFEEGGVGFRVCHGNGDWGLVDFFEDDERYYE